MLNKKNICEYIHENHYSVIWKKNRKDSLQNGVGEIDRNFIFVKKNKGKQFKTKSSL